METGHFTRISCWIYSRLIPPIPANAIIYYESSWDTKTNKFVMDNLDKINHALATYPSGYCSFQLFYVHQPALPEFDSEEDRQKDLQQKAEFYKEATSPFEGIISCALLHDKGHEEPTTQRVMTFNIEDCTEKAIIAAIRLMSHMADKFKDDVIEGSGSIPSSVRQMWQVDLKKEYTELYNSTDLWLSGNYEMCLTMPILEYKEDSHRLWFFPSKKMEAEKFDKANGDLKAQAYYLFFWNHFDIIRDSDFKESTSNMRAYLRLKEWKKELEIYYRKINDNKPLEKRDGNKVQSITYPKAIEDFCSRANFKVERSRIRKSFVDHETRRVQATFAKKMSTYYEIDGDNGYIKLNNRDTIILPDELKRILPVSPNLCIPGFKLSRYNFFQKYITGESVVYNPLYNSMLVFDKGETEELKNGQISNQVKRSMIKENILVPDDRDELTWYENTYIEHNNKSEVLSLAIMPTLACNCDCPYCFERKSGKVIDDKTEDAIVEWITKQLRTGDYKKLTVDWFGGEPMLQLDIIRRMSYSLISICRAYDVTYTAGITTNGLLMNNDSVIRMLKNDCVITNVQVTFDGDRDAHNTQKFTQGKRRTGTYDQLMKNVQGYCNYKQRHGGLNPLRVRINISDANYDTIENLLKDLEPYKRNIVIFFRWVYANGNSHWKEYSQQHKGSSPYVGIYRLQMLALVKGFEVDDQYDKCHLRFSHCEADSQGFYTIDPEGNLYQCVHEYSPEFAVGNVREGISKQVDYDTFRETTGLNDEVCRTCKWLPMCHGGCRRYRINHNKHLCIDEKQNMELYIDMLYTKFKFKDIMQ